MVVGGCRATFCRCQRPAWVQGSPRRFPPYCPLRAIPPPRGGSPRTGTHGPGCAPPIHTPRGSAVQRVAPLSRHGCRAVPGAAAMGFVRNRHAESKDHAGRRAGKRRYSLQRNRLHVADGPDPGPSSAINVIPSASKFRRRRETFDRNAHNRSLRHPFRAHDRDPTPRPCPRTAGARAG